MYHICTAEYVSYCDTVRLWHCDNAIRPNGSQLISNETFSSDICINKSFIHRPVLTLVLVRACPRQNIVIVSLCLWAHYRWVARCSHCWWIIWHNWKKNHANTTLYPETRIQTLYMQGTCHQLPLSAMQEREEKTQQVVRRGSEERERIWN